MKNIIFMCLLFCSNVFADAKNTRTEGGRFQLIQLSDFRRDQYMIDTQTGKIWVRSCLKFDNANPQNCISEAWTISKIEGINATAKEILQMASPGE